MSRLLTRRDMIRLLEMLPIAGISMPKSLAQTSSTSTAVNASISQSLSASTSQMLSNYVSSGISTLNSASSSASVDTMNQMIQGYSGSNGPEIGPSTGPSVPYVPQPEKPDNELEGLVYPEDYPPDYMNFNPQTGLFDDIII